VRACLPMSVLSSSCPSLSRLVALDSFVLRTLASCCRGSVVTDRCQGHTCWLENAFDSMPDNASIGGYLCEIERGPHSDLSTTFGSCEDVDELLSATPPHVHHAWPLLATQDDGSKPHIRRADRALGATASGDGG